jgi:hypothetical protein
MSKAEFLKQHQRGGEVYAGIILSPTGDYHVFLLSSEAESINWPDAKKWATKQGGELPTRQEQSLLFANCKAEFKCAWYWSSEQNALDSGCAWVQGFGTGSQDNVHADYGYYRARAVRRLTIEGATT